MGQTVTPLVPVDRHGITATWLTSALRSTGAIAPGTRVSACAHHPVVAVSASGEARDDGGGLSGPQLVRLQLTYEGGTGPAQMVVKIVHDHLVDQAVQLQLLSRIPIDRERPPPLASPVVVGG